MFSSFFQLKHMSYWLLCLLLSSLFDIDNAFVVRHFVTLLLKSAT